MEGGANNHWGTSAVPGEEESPDSEKRKAQKRTLSISDTNMHYIKVHVGLNLEYMCDLCRGLKTTTKK